MVSNTTYPDVNTPEAIVNPGSPERCPVDHESAAQYKTPRASEVGAPAIERGTDGVWHIHGFDEAKVLLRNTHTRQAGFKAEVLDVLPSAMRRPILFQEGEAHLEQRKNTARFFTPKATEAYREAMEAIADEMVGQLKKDKRADLHQLSLGVAMRVASQVIGLTNSRIPGIEKRLDVFFGDPPDGPGKSLASFRYALWNRLHMGLFFALDVKPAIAARQRQRQDDVISYLIDQNYNSGEILIECVTYAAAGMVTTREFIALATWHLMEQPRWRERFIVGSDAERHAILHEILRLEPIVGTLMRRAEADIVIESQGTTHTIRKGDLVRVDVQAVNADESVVGEGPQALCPMREMHKQVLAPSVMGFGDGHHRCPGAYVALQETAIFLQRLLKLEGLRIEREPELVWSSTAQGYELHRVVVTVD